MEYIVGQDEMKTYDETTIHHFKVPALTLMERAALSVVEHIVCETRERILVLCGSGNNGGDGFAVARLLLLKGCKVQVLFTGNREHLSESCRLQWDIYIGYAEAMNVTEPVVTTWQEQSYDIIIDAVFGIGLNRNITGKAAEIIRKANETEAHRIAIDIPSGVDTDTGKIYGVAFCADETITFAFIKRGLLLYPGAFYAGTIYCTQIGITKESMLGNEPQAFCYTMKDIDRLPKRVADGNKGTFGKIGFLTGCDTIGGAAVLSATAAYRMGSGYVRVMTHTNNKEGLLQRIPEAVVTCYDDEMGYEERQKLLEQIIQKSDVLAVGAGIGMGEWAYRMVEKLLNRVAKPLVIDADACNIIAASETCKTWLKETSQSRKYPIIMTPHLAEFSRLCGVSITALKEDFPKAVTQFAKEYGVVLVGKDACTLISDCGGRLYMNRSGNDALATAGSGDVLLGMIASLLGQGMSAFDAACMGVYLHGLCGDFAKAETNARFVIASDISLQLAKLPI